MHLSVPVERCPQGRAADGASSGRRETVMKKAIVGLSAVGAVVGLRPLARRMSHKMREHCRQMAARCKQMAEQFGGHGEAVDRT